MLGVGQSATVAAVNNLPLPMRAVPQCSSKQAAAGQPWSTLPPLARTCMQSPLRASHIHTLKSSEPARTTSPLGCHVTQCTSSAGPSSVLRQAPSAADQTRTVESRLPVARRLPDALKARDTIVSLWPGSS